MAIASPTAASPEQTNETDPFADAERARLAAAEALAARVALEEEAERARLRAHEARQARLRAEERAERAKTDAEDAEQARLVAEVAARRARIAARAAGWESPPSRRAVLVPLTYLVLGVAASGLVVLNILAWTGGLIDEAEGEPAQTQVARPAAPPPSRPSERAATPAVTSPSIPTITLSAVRGDCWVSVRAGTQAGQILYEGLLARGDALRFKQRKLWLRLGAASNLEISVDGKPAEVPAGTVDVVLPA